MEFFIKEESRVVDQSSFVMPPVWRSQKGKARFPGKVIEDDVFISDKRRVLAHYLVEMIDNARHDVVLCSFLIADEEVENAVFEATQRGVAVYIMLACENRLEGDTPDDEFGKECLKQHIAMLKRFGTNVFIRSAPHYHAKTVLVDVLEGTKANARGVLLTANLTKEALGRNEELAVELSTSELEEITQVCRWAMFEYAEHEMLDKANFRSVKSINQLSFPSVEQIAVTATGSNSIREYALELIANAKSRLIVSSFGWDEDHPVVNALCSKAQSGVDVTVLARIRPSSMNALIKLKQAGATVLGFKWLHAKAIWNDSNAAMIMSANLQKHGLDSGFEMGVKLEGARATALKRFLKKFCNNAKAELLLEATLGDLSGSVAVWENEKLQDIEVVPYRKIKYDDITACCITRMDVAVELPRISWSKYPFHKVEFEWKVVPPKFNAKWKEVVWKENVLVPVKEKLQEKTGQKRKPKKQFKVVKHSYDPPVYLASNGETAIVIEKKEEISRALELKKNDEFKQAVIVVREFQGAA